MGRCSSLVLGVSHIKRARGGRCSLGLGRRLAICVPSSGLPWASKMCTSYSSVPPTVISLCDGLVGPSLAGGLDDPSVMESAGGMLRTWWLHFFLPVFPPPRRLMRRQGQGPQRQGPRQARYASSVSPKGNRVRIEQGTRYRRSGFRCGSALGGAGMPCVDYRSSRDVSPCERREKAQRWHARDLPCAKGQNYAATGHLDACADILRSVQDDRKIL